MQSKDRRKPIPFVPMEPLASGDEGEDFFAQYEDDVIHARQETAYDRFFEAWESKKAEIEGKFLCRAKDGTTVRKAMLRSKESDRFVHLRQITMGFDTYEGRTTSQEDTYDNEYTPLTRGPVNKNLTTAEYLDSHAKAFWLWNYNPIAKQAIRILKLFSVGRGVRLLFKNRNVKKIVTAFWEANAMDERIGQWLIDLRRDGELFLRYFNGEEFPKVRSLDPSTIWDVATNPEDLEEVYFYHQQYQTPYQLFSPPGTASMKYVVNQIPAEDMDHFKINVSAWEKRGRSDLLSVQLWLKLLKDYLVAKGARGKAGLSYVWDITIDGGADAQAAAKAAFPKTHKPGSIFIHNTAAKLEAVKANFASEPGNDGVVNCLLSIIAMGIGLAKEFLGTTDTGGTRASAIMASEPSSKLFEDCQALMERIIRTVIKRVIQGAIDSGKLAAGVNDTFEVIFPEIATGDRSAKLKDISLAEAMGWITKKRAAEMAVREFNITDFDVDQEFADISAELDKGMMIAAQYAQVEKGAPTLDTGPLGMDVPAPDVPAPEEPPPPENPLGQGAPDLKDQLTTESVRRDIEVELRKTKPRKQEGER